MAGSCPPGRPDVERVARHALRFGSGDRADVHD